MTSQKAVWVALLKLFVILAISLCAAVGTYSVMQPENKSLFANSDFENGNLKNWISDGAAFETQPTLGDNPRKRGLAQSTDFQGQYWLGTYEKRPNEAGTPGAIQGDVPTGKLTSIPFTIQKNKIAFLAGAGNGTAETIISLIVNDKVVLVHNPNGFIKTNEVLFPVIWDVSAWKKQKARITILDQASGAWGHINADNFHYE